jgi:hypothetical protein
VKECERCGYEINEDDPAESFEIEVLDDDTEVYRHDFCYDDERPIDRNPEGDPTRNGAFG